MGASTSTRSSHLRSRLSGGARGVAGGLRRLLDAIGNHPVRRLFGESRLVTWGAIVLLALVGLLLVRPVAMSLLSYQRTDALLTERRAEVAELEARHDRLTEQLEFYRTDAFVEERARTYGWVRQGERSYVIRELEHPESAAGFAIERLRSATVDHPLGWTPIGVG